MGDETVFDDSIDSEETVFDSEEMNHGEETVFDGVDPDGADETVYESNVTFYEGESEVRKAEEAVTDTEFQRGRLLLNTYRIDSDAIQGGMGSVWRVYHENWDTLLAMKRPKASAFETKAQKDGFVAECENWIDLGLHPNIVTCYYVRDLGGIPTIFSEWMENGSLESHIRDGSLYDGTEDEVLERLLDIAVQFARGLKFAHKNQLIHQDVKPDNLLLSKSWEAKVSDFGLAKVTEALKAGGCTPAYCSPEQASHGTIGFQTDLYSFAVSVLEMFLGDKPWAHGQELTGPLAGIACEDYFEMCRILMPERLKTVLRNCLQQDPSKRPADFEIVEEELRQIYQETFHQAYPRMIDRETETGNSMNNRAVSYFDLGRGKEAEQMLREAWEKYPFNVSIVYNNVLVAWRSGKMSYDEAWGRIDHILEYNHEKGRELLRQFEEESDLHHMEHDSEATDWEEQQKHNGMTECQSPDGRYQAIAHNYKTGPVVELIPLPQGSGQARFIHARGWITAIGFQEDGDLIFATRIKGTRAACRYHVSSRQESYTYFPKEESSITDFDASGLWAVSENGNLYDARTGCNVYHYGFLRPFLSRDGEHVYDDECKELYPTPRRDVKKAPWSLALVFDNQEAMRWASQFEEYKRNIRHMLDDRDFAAALDELAKVREHLKTVENSDFELEYYKLNREVGADCKIEKIMRCWQVEDIPGEEAKQAKAVLLGNPYGVYKKDKTFVFQKAVPHGQKGKSEELLTLTQSILEPSIEAGCISEDGTLGITGARNGLVTIWDLNKKSILYKWKNLKHSITAVSISMDNKFAVAADERGHVCVWKLRTGELFKRCEFREKPVWRSFAFDGFYEWLACGGWKGELGVIPLQDGKAMYHYKNLGEGLIISDLAYSVDGERLWSYVRNVGNSKNTKGGRGELLLWSSDLNRKLVRLEPSIEVQQLYLPQDQNDVQIFCGGRYLSRHYPGAPFKKEYLSANRDLILYEFDYLYGV